MLSDGVVPVDSRESRSRRLRMAIEAWAADLPPAPPAGALLITLTFAGNPDRSQAAGEVRRFVQILRVLLGVDRYFWFAELQKRGVIHYHIIILGRRFISHKALSRWWGRGFVWVQFVGVQNAFQYALAYAKKLRKRYQQDYGLFSSLYKGFRIFSHNRLQDWFARSWKYPSWLRELIWERGEIPRRLAGVGWIFPSSGEIFGSPWRLLAVEALEGGGWLLVLMLKDSPGY